MSQNPRFLLLTVGLCALRGSILAAPSPFPLERMQQVLQVPVQLAEVIDAQGTDSQLPQFILIQDVHRHAEVQNEIAAMLRNGRRAWNIRTVFVEGAFSEVPLDNLRDKSDSQSLATLVREGRLSGAEMAAVIDKENALRLIGIEEPTLYKRNLDAYETLERHRNEALDELRTIEMLQFGFGLERSRYDKETLQAMDRLLRLKWRDADQSRYGGRIAIPESPTLRHALRTAEMFYAIADERSYMFLEKSLSTPVAGPRVLIVGGYHTPKMTEELRRQGRSYAVLSPRVTQPANDALYRERLQESISALKLEAPDVSSSR